MKQSISLGLPLVALAAMVFVVTGCPHNDYTVTLKPQGDAMDRTLVFYRADGGSTNKGVFVPNYQGFDPTELADITNAYPAQAATIAGQVYTLHGSFGTSLPDDIGGAGSYTNWSTSLGDAGFYAERFRGNDDIASMAEARYKAADQLTELLIGWSHKELGHEKGYSQLRQFLDRDFRRDLKNASSYLWEGELAKEYQTNADQEFLVRYGQYLHERGYFSLDEIPTFVAASSSSDSRTALTWLQRLVARKMGMADSAAIPPALSFLGNDVTLNQSFTNYVAHSDLYRDYLKRWKKEAVADPHAKAPTVDDVISATVGQLLAVDFNLFGDESDHLTVKLSLPAAPLYSNGRWDAGAGQVVWSSDLNVRKDTNSLPHFCYANWVQPAENFQQTHFGRVALKGDDLTQYCLWRCSRDAQHGAEWDAFLAGLQPGTKLLASVDAFRFSDEVETNSPVSSKVVRDLLKVALQ